MICALAAEEVFGFLDEDVAADVGDGIGKRDMLGTGLDAVLCETALLNSAVAGQCAETFFREDFAGWMIVEELDLGDGGGADEACFFIELRANFHTAGAGDAVRQWVVRFLLLREDAWAGAEIVGAVDRNPGFDAHEVVEKDGSVYLKIADQREFGQRLYRDRLLQIFNERGAGH